MRLLMTALVLGLSSFAWSQEQLRDSRGRAIIYDLQYLTPESTFPSELLEKYDSRTLGEAIVAEIERRHVFPADGEIVFEGAFHRFQTFPVKATAPPEVHLYFDAERTESILKHGFLSVHQTDHLFDLEKNFSIKGRANMGGYVKGRALLEENMAGYKLSPDPEVSEDPRISELRPKSAILELSMSKKIPYGINGGRRWGRISAVMSDKVLKRTTFTPYDSLVLGPSTTASDRARKIVQTPFQDRFTIETLFKGRPDRWDPKPSWGYSEYFEAQIWGRLDFSDVKEFLIPEDYTQSELNEIKKIGKPIYTYTEDPGSSSETEHRRRYRRVKKALVYPGIGLVNRCSEIFAR
jgi:hypothetical protein